MPTVNEVMERVGRLKPCALDDKEKARWLMELDGQLYDGLTKADRPAEEPPRLYPEDGDKPLLVKAPYDSVYDLYLTAMICFYMREYSDYNNATAMFSKAMGEYRAKYRRDHTPKAGYLNNVMG